MKVEGFKDVSRTKRTLREGKDYGVRIGLRERDVKVKCMMRKVGLGLWNFGIKETDEGIQ